MVKRVAVALSHPHYPLVYKLPETSSLPRVGSRVIVPLNRKPTMGVIVEINPDLQISDKNLEEVLEILDLEPLITEDLVKVAYFISDYYLCSIGEAFLSMIPSFYYPIGKRSVALTHKAIFGSIKDGIAKRVVEFLLTKRNVKVSDLFLQGFVSSEIDLEKLVEKGVIRLLGKDSDSYEEIVSLTPLSEEERFSLLPNSAKSRKVVDVLLHSPGGVPLEKLLEDTGVSRALVRKLYKLGIVNLSSRKVESVTVNTNDNTTAFSLSEEQRKVFDTVSEFVKRGGFKSFLLKGVTGAGKTVVYIELARYAASLGKGIIILLPEIALVPSLISLLNSYLHGRVAILHSALSRKERERYYRRIISGEIKVVVGARSALFAPVSNLGLIVVDEEQDVAYKQERAPRYNARDIAVVRASYSDATVLLVSATPSLESYLNVEKRKYSLLTLRNRYYLSHYPRVKVVDLRKEELVRKGEVIISNQLFDSISKTLAKGEQVILLRNRRGYAPLLLCRACGFDHRCSECALPMTIHKRGNILLCHYCGRRKSVPKKCVVCSEEALDPIGSGTEKVEEIINELFPSARTAILDRDTVMRPSKLEEIIVKFKTHQIDILIGTQMVAKGHHFPKVTLAAALLVDSYLLFPDFRSVERSYNVMVQLGGRCSREGGEGELFLQTYHPEHYAIKAIENNNEEDFLTEELNFRKVFFYPPYSKMILLLVTGIIKEKVIQQSNYIYEKLEFYSQKTDVRINGPSPPPLEKIDRRWRYHLILRSKRGSLLRSIVRKALGREIYGETVIVDVDPVNIW